MGYPLPPHPGQDWGGTPARSGWGTTPGQDVDGVQNIRIGMEHPLWPGQDGDPPPSTDRDGVPPWTGQDGVLPQSDRYGVPPAMTGMGYIPPSQVRLGYSPPPLLPSRTSHGLYMLWSVRLLRFPAGGFSCYLLTFLVRHHIPNNLPANSCRSKMIGPLFFCFWSFPLEGEENIIYFTRKFVSISKNRNEKILERDRSITEIQCKIYVL